MTLGCRHVQMPPVAPAADRQTDRQSPSEAEDKWRVYQRLAVGQSPSSWQPCSNLSAHGSLPQFPHPPHRVSEPRTTFLYLLLSWGGDSSGSSAWGASTTVSLSELQSGSMVSVIIAVVFGARQPRHSACPRSEWKTQLSWHRGSLCHQEHRKRQGHHGLGKSHGNVDLKVLHKIQVR